jgi:hypothetical protein
MAEESKFLFAFCHFSGVPLPFAGACWRENGFFFYPRWWRRFILGFFYFPGHDSSEISTGPPDCAYPFPQRPGKPYDFTGTKKNQHNDEDENYFPGANAEKIHITFTIPQEYIRQNRNSRRLGLFMESGIA